MVDRADWQSLSSSAIARRHSGDICGAIEDMAKAIDVMQNVPSLAKETSVKLNYLADMYLESNAISQAESAIREAIEFCPDHFPCILGDNHWILGEIQRLKGEYRQALVSAEEARRLYQQGSHSHGVAQANELIARINHHLDACLAQPDAKK